MLSSALEKLLRDDPVPQQFFENAVIFAREFVDEYHHYKEEHQMFVFLAQKSGGIFDAQIDALRQQHEHGRMHVTRIVESVPGYLDREQAAATEIVESLAAYIAMLRQHIHREDHAFYPIAQRVLTADDAEQLLFEFERADAEARTGFVDECRDRVLKMEALLQVQPQAETRGSNTDPGGYQGHRGLNGVY